MEHNKEILPYKNGRNYYFERLKPSDLNPRPELESWFDDEDIVLYKTAMSLIQETARITLPEHDLLEAMLRRTVLDLAVAPELEKRLAVDWIKSESEEPFSYLWTCQHLGICFKTLRKRVALKYRRLSLMV